MSNNNSSDSREKMRSSILVILLAGSLSMAIVDKENRPVYLEIMNLVVVYSLKTERKTGDSNDSDNLHIYDSQDKPNASAEK